MSDEQPAVIVKDVSKTFQLPHEKHNGIKQAAVNLFNKDRGFEKQKVLNDISFEIKKGEFFGIVGRNGSGKSTLLKLLAGIYVPDEGLVQVNGSLTPFIELGVGFNPELTGRENVYMNGALLGFSRTEMDGMYDEIVEFAEIERFMDQKLKNYSSGMQVRLAFSIAVRARSDILLIDEVLAVGDAAFQKKCYEYFARLKKQKQTVILVTHDMGAVERFCTSALVIQNGVISKVMKPHEAATIYEQLNVSEEAKSNNEEPKRWGNNAVNVDEISVNSKTSKNNHFAINQSEDLVVTIKTSSQEARRKFVVGMAIFNDLGVNISGPNSEGYDFFSGQSIDYVVKKLPLNPGTYIVTLILFDEDLVTEYDHIQEAFTIDVIPRGVKSHGLVNLYGKWRQYED